ncbi:Vacuolar protein sorting-associated protein 29 [Diplonema papillatum]|nr:Vacuolar protein sorting-associated protein 29 [Diplonema papillatum]
MLVLVLGDLHIPHRAADIPPKFKNMLAKAREEGKIASILCTGNVCNRETYDFLKTLCNDVHVVAGDFDDDVGRNLPEYEVVRHGNFRIGLIHGHQIVPWGDAEALGMWQRKLNCDILVSGFTHKLKAEEIDGGFFVNPGSITGAFSPTDSDPTPSFVLMEISGDTATNFIYQLKNDDSKVTKRDFVKKPSHS